MRVCTTMRKNGVSARQRPINAHGRADRSELNRTTALCSSEARGCQFQGIAPIFDAPVCRRTDEIATLPIARFPSYLASRLRMVAQRVRPHAARATRPARGGGHSYKCVIPVAQDEAANGERSGQAKTAEQSRRSFQGTQRGKECVDRGGTPPQRQERPSRRPRKQ
jgi:hypothetical protein